MGATVAFTDLGDLAGTSFPEVGELEDERLYLESEIGSEYNFGDHRRQECRAAQSAGSGCDCRPHPIHRAPAR